MATTSPTILGLDISSYQLDGAFLIPGRPFVLRREVLGKAETGKNKRPALEQLIDRVRKVDDALVGMVAETMTRWPDWLVIEDAFGPSGRARKALDLITGSIIAAAPLGHTKVKLLKASQWRSYLGEKNTKADGHAGVYVALSNRWSPVTSEQTYDEHQLDALGVALGWQAHLQKESVV